MTRELVELCEEQDTFNTLVDAVCSVREVVELLQALDVEDSRLRGAVYGWALHEAGL